MPGLRSIVKHVFLTSYHACLSFSSRRIDRELAGRTARHGQRSLRWFTEGEAAIAEALAKIIVPSDEETPGLDDIDVLGPSAIVLLDKLLSADPERQQAYSRGLLSFDLWAKRERGCNFAELPKGDQILLLSTARRRYEHWSANVSPVIKAWRRLSSIVSVNSGKHFAAQLYPYIRSDCLQIFYCSRVSWVWLQYDGPPMDEGYPRLQPRR
ncbi:MAG: gluconate 2-dehydrogenase subunit 3 family protein [Terracidiphilus sp.]